MQEGFVTDHSYTHVMVGRWIEGPESSWLGLYYVRGKKWLPTAIYRCLSCSYFERYAKRPFVRGAKRKVADSSWALAKLIEG
jgi:hypothetical protein